MKKTLLLLLVPLLTAAWFIYQQQARYVGATEANVGLPCATCHSGTLFPQHKEYTQWVTTAHATAYDSASAFVQGTARCLTCHTTGWDTTVVNFGADEYVTINGDYNASNNISFASEADSTGFIHLANVQCESCHGPASEHTADPNNVKPPTLIEAEVCGSCHQGVRRSFIEEWQMSKHAISNTHPVPSLQNNFRNNPTCSGCHTQQGFVQFVGTTTEDTLNVEPNVVPPGDAALPIVCSACHDPHPAVQHEKQLRLDVADICIKCHNSEDAQPPDTPHHAMGNMWEGNGAVEFAGYTYRTVSPHQLVEPAASKQCATCHVFRIEFTSEENPARTGHTFEPKIEACGQEGGCHSSEITVMADTAYFNDVPADAFSPFDRKGRQSYTDSLLTVLYDILSSVTPEDSMTQTFAEAKFNYEFVDAAGSHGVHNPFYAEDILNATIEVARNNFTIVSVEPIAGSEIPQAFRLQQNYPNPFNPSTTIEFDVPNQRAVKLVVHNALGQVVATLVDEELPAGNYRIVFDAAHLSSGTYFYRIESGDAKITRTMLLVK